jgi:hypothetical protein
MMARTVILWLPSKTAAWRSPLRHWRRIAEQEQHRVRDIGSSWQKPSPHIAWSIPNGTMSLKHLFGAILARTMPATLDGVLAVLEYAAERDRDDYLWPLRFHIELVRSLRAAMAPFV